MELKTVETEQSTKTAAFGGNGGSAFETCTDINMIGLRTGSRVDQITINGASHGGGGGSDIGTITLGSDDYICDVEIRSGSEVDYVRFLTSDGVSIGGGGSGGSLTRLENIRVTAIGGRSGSRVDKLEITYIPNYKG